MMPRLRGPAVVFGLLAVWGALPHGQPDRAAEILARARAAIGGEARLRGVRSLSVNAESSTTFAGIVMYPPNPGAPDSRLEHPQSKGKVEIDVLLPDRFLVSRRGGPSGFRGLNGQAAIVAKSSRSILADPRLLDRVTAQQHRQFMVYMIALLLMPPAHYDVHFTDGGQANIESGPADVLQANGPYDFAVQLFFDKETHRLLHLDFREPPRSGSEVASSSPGKAGVLERTPEAPKAAEAGQHEARGEPLFKSLEGPMPPRPVMDPSMQIRLADYRPVDGVLLPYRITTDGGGATDDWRVSKYEINPALKPKLFEKR